MGRRGRSDRAKEPVPVRGAITTWPAGERPREKLLQRGAPSLTDAELLAILLRTGSGARSAVDLAHELLARDGNLRGIARRNAEELTRQSGVGHVKAAEILAAFEIGRRLQMETDREKFIVRSPADAARILVPRMRDLPHEAFVVLVLDSNNGVVADVELSRGTLNASLVHPREVYKCAIDRLGAAVLVAHNHPSGNPEPSREDIEITRQLAEAGRVVGIPLHDHLIIAGNICTSLAERGLLP